MTVILKEGGNVFDGTSDFDHAVIPQLTKAVNSVLDNIKIKGFPLDQEHHQHRVRKAVI